jgi:hypothetical protein
MRYTRLSTYDIIKGTFPELTGIVGKGMLPLFNKEPGFVDYGLVDAGNNKVVAISIWETREEAQKSVVTAATWIKQNISDRVNLVTTAVGDMALFHGTPVHGTPVTA